MKNMLSLLMGALLLGSISMGTISAGAELAVNLREHLREAVRNVRSLPKIEREAWLAQAAGLLFCQDGRSVYTGKTGSETVTIKKGKKTETARNSFKEIRLEAVFIGSDGKLYNFRALCAAHKGGERTIERWKLAGYYANRAGVKNVLAEFAEETAALKQQRDIYMLKNPTP